MKLLLPRESFVKTFTFNRAVASRGFTTLARQSQIRGEFWDFMNGVDEPPPVKDLLQRFNLSEHTIRRWAEILGFPFNRAKRTANAVASHYKKIVETLERQREAINLTQLCELCFNGRTSLNDTQKQAVDQLKRRRPELYSKIVFGRDRRSLARSKHCKSSTEDLQNELVAFFEKNPETTILDAARALDLTLLTITHHARRLVTKGDLPERVLTVGVKRVAVARNQYERDWATSPKEFDDVNLTTACYMYGVTVDDMRTIEIKTGLVLPYDKKTIAVLKRGGSISFRGDPKLTTTAIERAAHALADALDRRASFAELAAVLNIPRDLVGGMFKASPSLEKYVDPDLETSDASLSYGGDYIEGAGKWSAPAIWREEVIGGGYMGVNLTGGYWRRYYQLFEYRQRGEMFKNGVFVEMVTVAPR